MKTALRICSTLAMLATSHLLFAQITGGSFVGNVTDPSGASIVNAAVQVRNVETNVTNKTVTNQAGEYEFPLLPAGRYVLSVEAAGFRPASTNEVVLHAGTQPRVDFTMVIGQATQSVQVTATAPLVNATNTELGVVIDTNKIEELPLNGRNFTQLLSLQPGWNIGTYAGQRGGVEINGTPGLGNNWLMDGMDMSLGENNGVGIGAAGGKGTTLNTISIEAIEEFKTTTGAFNAEYGHSTGAVINLVTKSGTNQFHGTAWEFFRNDKLDANNFFSNRSGSSRPPLRYNQYGANLGGPLWRNRIFFFFNYEGAKVRQLDRVTGDVPTPLLLSEITNPTLKSDLSMLPSTCVSTSNPLLCFHSRNDESIDNEFTTLSRLDADLGKHRLGFRFNYNKQTVSNPTLITDIREIYPIPLHNWLVSDTMTITPTLLNEARFGYNHYPLARHTQSTDPADNTTVPGCCTIVAEARGIVAPGLSFSTLDLLAADTPTKSFDDNLTWVHGVHTFKMGFEVRDVTGDRTQYGNGAREFYNSLTDLINDNIYQLELDFGNPGTAKYKLWTYAGYLQDDWKISRRLQLNLGLRYEYYTPLVGTVGLQTSNPYSPLTAQGTPLWASRPHDFGPRGGLVYDFFGDNKTVLRAGGAISYLPPQPFNYYDDAWLSCTVNGVVTAIPAFPVVTPGDLPASLQPVTYPFPNSFLQQVRANPCSAPAGLAAGRSVAPPMGKDEHVEMWNISLQRQFTPTFVVQVSYVGNRALDLYTTSPYNYINPATGQRPVPADGPITYRENAATSWYHSLQVSANKRLSENYSFDVYYTWDKAMSYHGPESEGDNFFQDPNNYAASIGPNQGAVGQTLTLVHTYQVPTASFARGSSFGRAILGGWNLQGILTARTGAALNITLGYDAVGNGVGYDRPDSVYGVSQYVSGPNPLQFLNPAAYDAVTPTIQKRFGNLGFDTAVGPGSFDWDLGLHKVFVIHENHRLAFRFEVFNWMNHPIFGNPDTTLADATFGMITSSSKERDIQLALRYSF